MGATVVYVGIGLLLVVSVAILAVAVLLLRAVRRYVELAEQRLELLREGQEMLVRISRRERRRQRRGSGEERELALEPARGTVRGPERPTVRPAPPAPPTPNRAGAAPEKEPPADRRPRDPGASGRYVREALGLGGKGSPVEGGRRARKVPHPDDDVTHRGATDAPADAVPAKLFQKFYDRHLEHYEGYVRLVGRLRRTREDAGTDADAATAREWEDKLRRAHEAIERNTGRLDMLEEYYPELATDDDRIPRRAAIARLHAGLAECSGRGTDAAGDGGT